MEKAKVELQTNLNEDLYKSDPILNMYYQAYVMEGLIPDKREAMAQMTFLTTFSIGCSELGLPEIQERFNYRLSMYVELLRGLGFTQGKSRKGAKQFGIDDMLKAVSNQIKLQGVDIAHRV